MTCPKCESTNTQISIVNEPILVKDKPGCLWRLFIGWWWIPVKWIFFTIPALILKLFVPAKVKLQQRRYTVSVCQNCGFHWKT